MNRDVSVLMDSARLLAALLILLGHAQGNWMPGSGECFASPANESLAVLFVVSGFVIGYVSDRRQTTMKAFFSHRIARAYSVLIPCLIFGFLLDSAGKHLMPHYYHHGSWPPLGSDLYEAGKALFSLTFLGEAWGRDFFPGSMSPYWTFPYEWTFYGLFATVWYLRGWRRLLMPLPICLIAGPDILSLFPLWLIGLLTYWLLQNLRLKVVTGRVIFFAAMLVWLTGQTILLYNHIEFGYGVQESPALWPFYATGLLFALVTIGFRFADISISRFARWVRWPAGATGTLYLLHFPLGRFVSGLLPFDWPAIVRWPLLICPVIVISLLFAEIGERRREAWRRRIEAGFTAIEAYLANRKLPAGSSGV